MDKKSFILYNDYGKQIKRLSDEQCGRLLKALYAKACNEDAEFKLDPCAEMLFEIIADRMDIDREKYEERCRMNSLNGKKGGRPKTKKTERFFEKAKKADIDIDIDNDNDIDIDTECDINTNTLGEEEQTSQSKKKPRGKHGYVRLDDEAYGRLKARYDEAELGRVIEYLDESAKSTNNKNGWSDWELVIERAIKGSWGKTNRASPPTALNYAQKRYKSSDLKLMGIDILGME